MPKLAEQESKKLYYFTSKSNRKMQKYSGDLVSEGEIREFEIPNYLLEPQVKNIKSLTWVKNKEKNNS